MDLDIILKLISLGWNGKEDEFKFLKREYGVIVEEVEGKIQILFKSSQGKASHCIWISLKNGSSPISLALRLFRTENGMIIGPKSSLLVSEDQEWT